MILYFVVRAKFMPILHRKNCYVRATTSNDSAFTDSGGGNLYPVMLWSDLPTIHETIRRGM